MIGVGSVESAVTVAAGSITGGSVGLPDGSKVLPDGNAIGFDEANEVVGDVGIVGVGVACGN